MLDQNAHPLDISMDHLPVFQLLMNADPVVKGVMLLLAMQFDLLGHRMREADPDRRILTPSLSP